MTEASTSDPSSPLSVTLIGTWQLESRVDHTRTGERRVDPGLGEDPVASLIYDRAGHFAAQFMKRDRTSPAGAASPAATEQVRPVRPGANNTMAQRGYDAYFGTYTIDDARGTVTQTLHGALSPENVGQVLTREMTVVGDALTIELDTTAFDGEAITRTLRWTRVG